MSAQVKSFCLHRDGYSVVAFPKELNKAHPSEIREAGEQVVAELANQKTPQCIVDLTNLDHVGSSMVASIVCVRTGEEMVGKLEIVPTAAVSASDWFYTTSKPAEDWFSSGFKPTDWKSGKSGFGATTTPSVHVGTQWNSSDIWLIRDIQIDEKDLARVQWMVHHDEDLEIYVNGKLVETRPGYLTKYQTIPLSKAAKESLKAGSNRIAIHCHQETGGQYVDVGLVTVEASQP